MDFKGQTAVITGAAGNLGQAVAKAFEARGANLVLIDVKAEALARAFGSETATRLFAPTNLLEQAQVDATVKKAIDRFARIDVLCNLAGGFRMGETVHETTDANWSFLFDLNART
ncbi:MAG TPA: SDR family NAD(P)-dependent oxidoreductase, partial [Burkholderiaceae bacterium]|nr:SDR family NAD(P)-dependent oxidoreductase [Burkholderiaceae bacterium]